ncbi:SUMO activating enzyme [Aureococcus anophagefferens]|nr:SUMO activating enzyme [Aureococcus anophagefferens]
MGTAATESDAYDARYAHCVAAVGGPEVFAKVRRCKVLVVGAGGIGCELLKNLVLVGFESLVTVDLDTIDVSNLNRQFLFRKRHVGMAKAVVAREAVVAFNPLCSVEALHANIKEPRFGLAWFGGFDVVVNALDNVDARRHVNRMCLASDVPLIEAGTTGFLGQVFPVHCVVWAKELFKLLFGDAKESMLFEGGDDGPDASTYGAACAAVRGAPDAEKALGAALALLCDGEVRKQLSMDKYKTAKKTPDPLDGAAVAAACVAARAPSRNRTSADWDRATWTVDECCAELADVAATLAGGDRVGSWEFDKDEPDAMRFVAAAANLRSRIFHIAPKSLYEAKGIAGNIIPAIATTNAVVAGLQVAELLKLIRAGCVLGDGGDRPSVGSVCKYTYCLRDTTRRGLLLQPTRLEEPQATCYVCRKGKVAVALDTTTTTLRTFVDVVLKRKLGFVDPSVDKDGSGLFESEDERLAANLDKVLADLPAGGLGDNAIAEVADFASTGLELDVTIKHKPEADFDEKANPEKVLVLTGADATATAAEAAAQLAADKPRRRRRAKARGRRRRRAPAKRARLGACKETARPRFAPARASPAAAVAEVARLAGPAVPVAEARHLERDSAAAVVLRRGRGDPARSGRRAHGRVAKGQRVLRLELDVAGRRVPGVEEHDAPPVRGRRGRGGDEGPEPDVRGPRHRVDEVAGEADDAARDGRRGREHVPAPAEDDRGPGDLGADLHAQDVATSRAQYSTKRLSSPSSPRNESSAASRIVPAPADRSKAR